MKKKLSLLLMITGVVIVALILQVNRGVKAQSNEVNVNSQQSFIDAINDAPADFKTITDVVLEKDITIRDTTINVKEGQIINIVSKKPELEIGRENLEYALSLDNSQLQLDRSSDLRVNTNMELNHSSIEALEQHSETNDFYAVIEFNDSLRLNNSTISSKDFKKFDINGSLNIFDEESEGSRVISDSVSTIFLGSDATIICLTSGNIETIFGGNIVGNGSFVTNTTLTSKDFLDSNISVFENYVIKNTLEVNGNYILYSNYEKDNSSKSNSINLSADLEVSSDTNIFVFSDTIVNTNGYSLSVSTGATLNLGGAKVLADAETESEDIISSSGTNKLIFDAGAVWQQDNGGNAAFVTGDYDHVDPINSNRARYRNAGASYDSAIVAVRQGATFNMLGNVVLQNLHNTSSNASNLGAINLVGIATNNANFNMYGGKIQYNYLPNFENSGGGAGISATYAKIAIYDGAIIYNSVYNASKTFSSDRNSTDGAGISLIETSSLTMYGGQVSYNHGGSGMTADGGGIMVRNNSILDITNGEISNNFTFGYGGGICVWLSKVTINSGIIKGNRANFGGGIAVSSGEKMITTLTIGQDADSDVQVINNEAFNYEMLGGFGGGISLGNSRYNYCQELIINGGYIANNKAYCGGGISNSTIVGINGAKKPNALHINGGTIINNTASNSELGDGIYLSSGAGQADASPLIVFSGNARVDSSNNIVINKYDSGKIPIAVSGQLTATGIVGLIRFTSESTLSQGLPIVKFDSSLEVQVDKFLLDSNKMHLVKEGNNLVINQTTTSQAVAKIGDTYYNSLHEALAAVQSRDTSGGPVTETITILRNLSLTNEDLLVIPQKTNLTIKSETSGTPYTIAISKDFDFSTTINPGIMVIPSGSSLTLENIVFDGNSSISGGFSFVYNYGTFILGEDATLANNVSGYYGAAITNIMGAKAIIRGTVSGNKGPNGAIYNAAEMEIEATANIYNNHSTSVAFNGEVLELPIGIYVATNSNTKLVGDGTNIASIADGICYDGGSVLLENATTRRDIIDVYVADQQYKASTHIIEIAPDLINDSNPITNYVEWFSLVPHNPNDCLGYVIDTSRYFLMLDRIVEVVIDFSTKYDQTLAGVWEKKGNFDNLDITAIDTIAELERLQSTLGLLETPTLRGKKLVLFIHKYETINLVNLKDKVNLAGYTLTYYLQTNASMMQIDANGSVTYDDLGVTLDSVWVENTYTFIFDKNLSTAQGEMLTTKYTYNSGFIDADGASISRNLPKNKYYAIGFAFAGWYVHINNGLDIIEIDGAEISQAMIIQYQMNYGMTITLYARWYSIFGDSNTTENIGTAKNPFIISDEEGLKNLASTVSGIPNSNDKFMVKDYPYYNSVDMEYLAFDYNDYYFELAKNISSFEGVNYNGQLYTIGYLENIQYNKNAKYNFSDVIKGTPFSGNFDGDNKTININLSSTSEDGLALFGYTKAAQISNLTVTGQVSGHNLAAGIIGFAHGGNYASLTNKANVDATGYNVGGVISTYYIEETNYANGSIKDVVNEGNITYVGGLSTTLHYEENWSEDKVIEAVDGFRYGGVIGQGWHLQLKDAFNIGQVSARFSVGGIVGSMYSNDSTSFADSSVMRAFNIGNITATAGLYAKYTYNIQDSKQPIDIINAYAGGIVGRMFGAGEISIASNSGNVKASFVGYFDESTNTYIYTNDFTEERKYYGSRGAGGILGFTSMVMSDQNIEGGNKKIDYVYNTGDIEAWSNVGGIAGLFAFSEVNYAINIGHIKATGFHYENQQKVTGGFMYKYDGKPYYCNFLGGIVGMAVGSAIMPNAIFDGDIDYEGYTDSIIKAIGDSDVSRLGLPNSTSQARKLSTKNMIVATNDVKPSGFGSTFYDNHWTYKTYNDNKYYYPQLAVFANDLTRIIKDKSVSDYSKESVTLSYLSGDTDIPVEPDKEVHIYLQFNEGDFFVSSNNGVEKIEDGYRYSGYDYHLKDGLYQFAITFDSGETLPIISAAQIQRLGYQFEGWYKDSAFSEEFDFSTIPSFDTTLYAKWVPIEYTISYAGINAYADGQVSLIGDYAKKFTIENKEQMIYLPTRENFLSGNKAYSFVSWQYRRSENYYNVDAFMINSDNTITLYYNGQAVASIGNLALGDLEFSLLCEANPFTITYSNLFDGNKGSNPDQYTVKEKITFTKDATRPGYIFMGWYTDSNFTTEITEILAGTTGNLEVFAKWQAEDIPLVIDLKGGTLASYSFELEHQKYTLVRDSNGLYQVLIPYGTDISNMLASLSIMTTPSGTTFKGWSTNTEEFVEAKLTTMPQQRLDIFAYYEVKAYTITITAGSINGQDLVIVNFPVEHYNVEILSNNSIKIKAYYGDSISDLLDALLINILENNDLGDYNFLNWESNPSFSIHNITAEATELLLEAKYDKSVYSITLLDNKFSVLYVVKTNVESISIAEFSQYIQKIPGYTFANQWHLLEDKETIYTIEDMLTMDKNYNLVAIYEAKDLNVVYDVLESDELVGKVTTLKYESPYGTLPIVNRKGYDFMGWSRTPNGSIIHANDLVLVDNIEQIDSITLYPIMSKKHFTIEYYNLNGASNVNPSSYEFASGIITLVDPVRKGYTFAGWYYSEDDVNKVEAIDTNLATNIILYARWEVQKITVTFDAGLGSFVYFQADSLKGTFYADDGVVVTNENYTLYVGRIKLYKQQVAYGEVPTSPTINPRLTGNTFERYDGLFDVVTDIVDRTICAIYKLEAYTVQFVTGTELAIKPVIVNYNNKIEQVIQNPTKEGYRFVGWSLNGELIPNINEYVVTSNVTFVAEWEIEYYNLTIDVEVTPNTDLTEIKKQICLLLRVEAESFDGNRLIVSLPYKYSLEELNQLASADYTLTGYYFKGWFEGDTFVSLSTMPARDYVIKAIWQQEAIVTVTGVIPGHDNIVIPLIKRDGSYYLSALPTLNYEGYEFRGWFLDSEYQNQVTQDTAIDISNNREIYAQLVKKQIKISYQIDVNMVVQTHDVDYGTYLKDITESLIGDYSKPGYIFSCWQENGLDLDTDYIINHSITIIGKWIPIEYGIKFEGSEDIVIIKYGDSIDYPQLSKEYYTIKWYMYKDDKLAEFNYQQMPDLNSEEFREYCHNDFSSIYITVKAIYIPIEYKINFAYPGVEPLIINCEQATYNLPEVTKEHYNFLNWGSEGLVGEQSFTNLVALFADSLEITLTPVFEEKEYLLVFDSNEKNFTISDVTISFDWAEPTKVGAEFLGYSFNRDAVKADYLGTIHVADIFTNQGIKDEYILYAIFKTNEYTITYIDKDSVSSETVLYGAYAPDKPVETPIGYNFAGWYTANVGGTKFDFTQPITQNISLYARYTGQNLHIALEANGGEIDLPYLDIIYESVNKIAIPTKNGYNFLGWYVDSSMTKQVADASGTNLDWSLLLSANTIYAKWEIVTYYINYNLMGGINSDDNPISYTVLDEIILANATKDGYIFLGWYDEDDQLVTKINQGSVGNVTLVAKWEATTYQVIFYANGGQGEMGSQTMTYDGVKTLNLNQYTRLGYSFLGWSTQPNGSILYMDGSAVALSDFTNQKLNLYACWGIITYYINYSLDGGINTGNPTTYTVLDEIVLTNATKVGYNFLGWYDEMGNLVERINVGQTGNLKLYAKYEIIQLRVRYLDSDGTLLNEILVDYNSTLEEYRPFFGEGQVFMYWLEDGNIYSYSKKITRDTTLVARYAWTALTKTIVVNGENVQFVIRNTNGDPFAIDYEIKVEALSNEDIFAKASNLLAKRGQLIYLYNISIVDANGAPVPISDFVRVEVSIPNLAKDTNYQTYYFNNDFNELSKVNTVVNDDKVSFVTDHFSYYGIVVPMEPENIWYVYLLIALIGLILLLAIIAYMNKNYKIYYHTNGGEELEPTKSRAGKVIVMPIPVRDEYVFAGWYLEEELINPANFKTMPRQKIDVYAKWEECPNDLMNTDDNEKKFNITNVETKTIRKSFVAQLTLHPELKDAYKEIKNEFIKYKKVHSRLSFRCERFSYGRLALAKLFVRGKRIYLYLALNPTVLADKYFVKDVSEKKIGEQLPTLLRVKSERSIKYAKELIRMLMEQNDISLLPEEKVVTVDYDSYLKDMSYEELLENNLIVERTRVNQIVEEIEDEDSLAADE